MYVLVPSFQGAKKSILKVFRCIQVYLSFRARCIQYPGSLQIYLFLSKIFQGGGLLNPVITQPAGMSSCLVPSLHFICPTLYLGFKLLACNPIFLMWPS